MQCKADEQELCGEDIFRKAWLDVLVHSSSTGAYDRTQPAYTGTGSQILLLTSGAKKHQKINLFLYLLPFIT